MLSQEELDKLLEGGGEEDSSEESSEATKGSDKPKQESSGPISQDDIDALLSGGGESSDKAEAAGDSSGDNDLDWGDAFAEAAAGGDDAAAKAMNEGALEEVEGSAKPSEPPSAPAPEAPAAQFNDLSHEQGVTGNSANLDFILEIPLEISVELGRSRMQIKDLLQLGQGSVVELNKMAGEPADIYVNQKLLAKGEVVVMNEKFGVKLTEIISPADRVKSLG